MAYDDYPDDMSANHPAAIRAEHARELRTLLRRYEEVIDFVRDLFYSLEECPARSWRGEAQERIETLFESIEEDF